jgi:hypothetical protein
MKIYYKNGKYGLMDDDKNIIIHPKYDFLFNFHNGFARYKLNKKYGFIDKNENEIIPPKYDYLWDFKNGFAKYELNKKYGIIDANGIELTKPLFNFYETHYISNRSNSSLWGEHNIIFKNYSIFKKHIKIIL